MLVPKESAQRASRKGKEYLAWYPLSVQVPQVWGLREGHENQARKGHFLAQSLMVQMPVVKQGMEKV